MHVSKRDQLAGCRNQATTTTQENVTTCAQALLLKPVQGQADVLRGHLSTGSRMGGVYEHVTQEPLYRAQ